MKICSLLPSATEIVFALGLGDRLVGVTHECDFPPEARRLPVVTRSTLDSGDRGSREIHQHIAAARHAGSSVYTLDHDLLTRLDPELILTQELCDVCAVSYDLVTEAVRRLEGARRVLSLQPTSLDGILATIEQVGAAAGVPERASALVAELRQRIEAIADRAGAAVRRPCVLALEWLDPPFIGGHWVPEVVRLAGGRGDAAREGRPSTRAEWSRISEDDPDIVVLMPCGFDLQRTVMEFAAANLPREWMGLRAVTAGEVYAVNGSAYFNRPGPRIVEALRILAEIVQPGLFPPTFAGTAWERVGAEVPGAG
ncbi:MAG: cobalamin-binding protein [Candidatus Rokubacteria bacterium]|nr:cobalamin-binding protein [Candidatus Rokubacteria bacterium]